MASVNASGASTSALAGTSTCAGQCNLLNTEAPDDESGPYKCIALKHPNSKEQIEADGNFDCNICLDLCQDPVVTMCGHLFCWSCLYSWLSLYSGLKVCPVCKANVHDKVIPLYGRGRVGSSAKKFPEVHIPCRPSASRSDHATHRVGAHNTTRIGEVRTTDAPCSVPSRALLDCFASRRIGLRCPAVPPHMNASFFQWHPHCAPSSVVEQQQRRRFNNVKEFVLHWAFIIVGLVTTIGFLVYG